MLRRVPKPSSLVLSSELLLGFKVPDPHSGDGSHIGCLPVTSIWTPKPAGASFSDINGKFAVESRLDAGVGVDNWGVPARALRSTSTIPGRSGGPIMWDPNREPPDRGEPRLVKGKP
jgi:hypothetical protein